MAIGECAALYYYLTPVLGGPGAPCYAVTDRPQLIGRSDQADILLLEATVSRQHAAIQLINEELRLEDLGSKHGTFVNSKKITSTTLQPGDVIVFGLTLVLRVEVSEVPLSAAKKEAERTQDATWTGWPAVGPLASVPTALANVDRAEVEKLQDKLAAARKLAASGVLCLVRLPDVLARLRDVAAQLERQATSEAATAKQMLMPIISELNQILDAIGLMSVRQEDVVVREVMERAAAAVSPEAAGREVRVSIDVAPGLYVRADRNRLETALIELLRNACEVSPAKAQVEVTAAETGGFVVLCIRDHGPGIDDELAQRAFDPFVTLPADGQSLGLGLLLARQLIMSMGASLILQSSPLSGTTLRIRFPTQ